MSDGTVRPFIIDQRPGPNGTVRVTWSLPGLQTATISVPWNIWLQGYHETLGAPLATLMAAMKPTVTVNPEPSPSDPHS